MDLGSLFNTGSTSNLEESITNCLPNGYIFYTFPIILLT